MMRLFVIAVFGIITAAASAQKFPVTDSLTGSGVIGAPWTQGSGAKVTSTCNKTATGLMTAAPNSMCRIIYTGASFGDDHYAQVVMTSSYLNYAANTGPCVRCTADGSGYVWEPSNGFVAVYQQGNYITTAIGHAPAVSRGDTIRLSINGSTITATNVTTSESVSGANTSLSTGSPGMWIDETGNGIANTSTTPTKFQADCYPSTCGALPVPSFAIPSGAFSMSVTVSITPPSGAAVCYTTDKTPPTSAAPGTCSHGTLYGGPFPLTESSTVKAISTQAGKPTSSETSILYTVTRPTTHYIRTDGGTSAQCDGLKNAPLLGAANKHCAISSPYYLLTDNSNGAPLSWSFVNPEGVGFNGGDTIQFEDEGPYYIGLQLGSGVGVKWLACGSDNADCVIPALPSGSSSYPTKLLGLNASACHNSSHSALVKPTRWLGINSVYWMLSLGETSYADVECLDFSQPDACTLSGRGAVPSSMNCGSGRDNYAEHGLVLQKPGTTSQGPSNSIVRDFGAHGLANEGITGQKMNLTSRDVMTFSDIYLYGNANTGWDGDAGACNISCQATGTINISYVTVIASGCMEVKPNGGVVGGKGFQDCVDQGYNGNGDNLVMIATNGIWNWDHIISKWGAQDCFDGLHMGDNPATTVQVNITNSLAEGCEGQQFKFGGNVRAYNLIGITNCRRFNNKLPNGGAAFAANPATYNKYVGLTCRANDGLALQVSNGQTVSVTNSTFVGYANPFFDIECNPADSTSCPANSYKVVLQDNLILGYKDPTTGTIPGGLYWGTATNPFANTGSVLNHNLWYGVAASSGNGLCPQEKVHEKNAVCTNPLLMRQSSFNPVVLDNVVPMLTSTSPAIGAGTAIRGVTSDFFGHPRPATPSIGALEYSSGPESKSESKAAP